MLYFSHTSLSAQESIGARSVGMGNSAVSHYDFFAIHNNQAGIAKSDQIGAGFSYSNRYIVQELSNQTGAFIVPTNSGVFGVSFSRYGYSKYNETLYTLAYGKTFGDHFSAGLGFDYYNVHISEGYGNKGIMTFEAGIIATILPQLNIAAHVFNPIQSKIAEFEDERLPSIIRTGFSYTFSDKMFLSIEAEKNLDYDPVFKAGVQYKPTEKVFFYGGLATQPILNSFGFGLELNPIRIDISTSYDYILGYTPAASLIYYFN